MFSFLFVYLSKKMKCRANYFAECPDVANLCLKMTQVRSGFSSRLTISSTRKHLREVLSGENAQGLCSKDQIFHSSFTRVDLPELFFARRGKEISTEIEPFEGSRRSEQREQRVDTSIGNGISAQIENFHRRVFFQRARQKFETAIADLVRVQRKNFQGGVLAQNFRQIFGAAIARSRSRQFQFDQRSILRQRSAEQFDAFVAERVAVQHQTAQRAILLEHFADRFGAEMTDLVVGQDEFADRFVRRQEFGEDQRFHVAKRIAAELQTFHVRIRFQSVEQIRRALVIDEVLSDESQRFPTAIDAQFIGDQTQIVVVDRLDVEGRRFARSHVANENVQFLVFVHRRAVFLLELLRRSAGHSTRFVHSDAILRSSSSPRMKHLSSPSSFTSVSHRETQKKEAKFYFFLHFDLSHEFTSSVL